MVAKKKVTKKKTDKRRANSGSFQPGNKFSRGRPKKSKAQKDFENLCKSFSDEAFDTVLQIMREVEKGKLQLAAAKVILEYAYGRPKQVQVIQGDLQGSGLRLVAEIDPRCESG